MTYPKCGADACNAPQPSAFPGSTQAAALQFTLQLSANQGILPFRDSQIAAVSYATQALFGPLYGIPHLTPLCLSIRLMMSKQPGCVLHGSTLELLCQ